MNVIIIGASGAIGKALVLEYARHDQVTSVLALSRSKTIFEQEKVITSHIDLESEESIKLAADKAKSMGAPNIVIIASGFLHNDAIFPEKSIRDLSIEKFQKNFAINTIAPAIIAKHFLPIMAKEENSIFASISARIGSISDNRLGGWYAYRASKAAQNMVLKNLSIEAFRRFKNTIIVGLHPGTVESALSEPFQPNVPNKKLFTPEFSAQSLIKIINDLTLEDSGKIFAWDGQTIDY